MARGGLHEFRVSTIHCDACDLLTGAKVFVSLAAELAVATTPVKPWDADPVVYMMDVTNPRAHFGHAPNDLVTENQRLLDDFRQLRPIAIGHMQIGMAYAAGLNPDQEFVRFQLGPIDIFDRKWLLEIMQDGCFHSRTARGISAPPARSPMQWTAHACAPRRKNSTTLSTRSLKSCGPSRSTAQRRTIVV